MIGDTISITFNAVSTTLKKINQDNYSSEYLYRDAAHELRLKIRHQNESVKSGQRQMERHQVDLTRTKFDSVAGDVTTQAYTVIRLPKGTDPDQAELLEASLCGFMTAVNIDKIVGWES